MKCVSELVLCNSYGPQKDCERNILCAADLYIHPEATCGDASIIFQTDSTALPCCACARRWYYLSNCKLPVPTTRWHSFALCDAHVAFLDTMLPSWTPCCLPGHRVAFLDTVLPSWTHNITCWTTILQYCTSSTHRY